MCSYTASTLAIRSKCCLPFHYLCLTNDQPFCCQHPCCQFSVSPRFFSGYLLGLSSQFHSKVLFHAGRRRLRVFYRSRDFDMMGLLAEPEERFTGLGEPVWRKARREIQFDSMEGELLRKEEITRICSSRSKGLCLVCDSELNKVGRGTGGNSLARYGYRKKDTGYNEVDVAEGKVREVHEYVDDSWRERRYSSKGDAYLDSRKDESTKRSSSFMNLGVKGAEEKTFYGAKFSRQGNLRESGIDGRSKKGTKKTEAQLDDELESVKRSSVSTNVRNIQKESSASAARKNCDTDHQVAGNDQRRRSLMEQSKLADFRHNASQSAAYRQREFEETSIRGKEERAYLEQNSSQVSRGEIIHSHRRALEQDESRRGTHRLNEASLSCGSDFERTSPVDGKSVKVIDAITNLAQDSSQASRDKRSQMDMELHLSVENVSEESKDKLIIPGNSIQLRGGERKQIDRGAVEHDKTRRNSQMLGEVSELYNVNMEAFSLSVESRKKSFSVQSSIPAKKDKGTQVEMHDAYYDQIEMPGFNADNIVNATSSWNSPASRVDIQEYRPLLASNQISSIRKENDQANKHAYLLYDAQMEFERSTSEFDLERSNNIRISKSNETYKSRRENEEAFTSTETSSYVLTQEQEEQRSSLTRVSSQSESMEMTSTGSLHAICSPQPTFSELNYDAGWVYQKGQHFTNYSAIKLDKSTSSHADELVDRMEKEVVAMKESGITPNVSVGTQIGKPGMGDIQSTLKIEIQNETSSTVLTQERKERLSSLLVGDNSQHKAWKRAPTGNLGVVSSSVKNYSEVDDHNGRDDIRHITHDRIESAFDKSFVFRSDELVDEIQQEIISLNDSGKEPGVSSRIQIEETGRHQSEGTAVMQVGEFSDSRGYGDGKHIKEGERLSSSGSGMRGPSDDMWGDDIQSYQETSNADEPEEHSPTSEAMDLTTPNAITRRSPKSLWSFLADIIQMSWILRGNSHSSTLKSDKRASSNESLSSEAWFSGPDPDADGAEDHSHKTKQIGLLTDSEVVTGSVELPLQELKNGGSLAVTEPDSSISSGFMTSGLSARTASSSVEADDTQYLKSSQGTLSNVVIVEQQLESALPSSSGMVESRVRDKVKVLKPSATYPAAVTRVGFSSAITQETGAKQMEAAQIGKDNNSSWEISELLLSSTVDSALPRITDPEEVVRPGIVPMLELDPFGEKLPEVGGIKETGIKQRKFQRNKQIPSEQFDEWEKAFKLENEQKKLDEFFMREAILNAKKGSDAWEVPVGAVLVQNGKIIARGCNMVEELRDSTAHAEMICIREASKLIRSWRLAV